jgi:RNA-directed DNA polymerase
LFFQFPPFLQAETMRISQLPFGRHPNQGRQWIKQRYWKTEGKRRWVFKDNLTLLNMSDTKIVRHLPLKLDKNPYIDQDYFARRRFKLLVNRTFGTTNSTPLAKAGGCPEGVRLHEA